jgi:hypothetical protein
MIWWRLCGLLDLVRARDQLRLRLLRAHSSLNVALPWPRMAEAQSWLPEHSYAHNLEPAVYTRKAPTEQRRTLASCRPIYRIQIDVNAAKVDTVRDLLADDDSLDCGQGKPDHHEAQ